VDALTHDPIHNRGYPQLPLLLGTLLLNEYSSGRLESVDAGCFSVLLYLFPRHPQSSPVINPFQYPLCLHSLCSVTVSQRRLPGGGLPPGSDRIAPDLRDFPLVYYTALALPFWFTGPFPFQSVSTLPGCHSLPLVCVFPQPSDATELSPPAGRVVRVFSSALLPGFSSPESSVLHADLPPSVPFPIRVSPLSG